MKKIDVLAAVLVVVGALNWGLVGLFKFDLVATLLGRQTADLARHGVGRSGIELQPSIAYGIRAYRNDSNLLMHVDKSTTHVISGIYHVDRSDDAEPWPIVIEDFRGNTNQVYLAPGDVLFYESSKCFHGRPHQRGPVAQLPPGG